MTKPRSPRSKINRRIVEALLKIPSLTPEQAERFRARIAAAVRADRDSR
ncbi:MAG: hypothetical protein ACOYMT_03510 [Chthoniobacterales bacterium]|jgi:hypothetical protein